MKCLIVNADDFGLSEKINTGIIEGHRNGIITSTTLMANMPGFKHAVKLAKANKELGIGVHLNLTHGIPLSEDKLTDRWGNFSKDNLTRLLMGKINYRLLENELREQIAKVKSKKIKITHLDGHKHIHVMPKVRKVVVKLAKEYDINVVRLPYERQFVPSLMFQNVKRYGINYHSLIAKRLWKKYGLYHPDQFFGFMHTGKMNIPNLIKILKSLKNGVNEVMVHPGEYDDKIDSSLKTSRKMELYTLTNWKVKEFISKFYIELINFGDLNDLYKHNTANVQ